MESQKDRLVIKESKHIKPGGCLGNHVAQPFQFMIGKQSLGQEASDLPNATRSLVDWNPSVLILTLVHLSVGYNSYVSFFITKGLSLPPPVYTTIYEI